MYGADEVGGVKQGIMRWQGAVSDCAQCGMEQVGLDKGEECHSVHNALNRT